MNNIEIFNQTEEEIDELETVRKVLDFAVKKENLKNVDFNVIIVREDYIHELNKNYRNIDRVTDVITFALEDDDTVLNASNRRVLGDVYICLDRAKSQAIEYQHSFLREICFLAVHGFYHLLGYDHQTKEEEEVMFTKQEEVLSGCGIKR
ncbi:MAG: rRNA maturation RNase YbeY [bacterium]|nr:rRNA maturation RNase YbeY [bacterium]